MITPEEAMADVRRRWAADRVGLDPADVAERAAVRLEERMDIEVRVLVCHPNVRLFLLRDGVSKSGYVHLLEDTDAVLDRLLEMLRRAAA